VLASAAGLGLGCFWAFLAGLLRLQTGLAGKLLLSPFSVLFSISVFIFWFTILFLVSI
jgi:hypothetical protein